MSEEEGRRRGRGGGDGGVVLRRRPEGQLIGVERQCAAEELENYFSSHGGVATHDVSMSWHWGMARTLWRWDGMRSVGSYG